MPVKEDLMSLTNIRFVLCLALICSTAAVVPASAQHFQQMEGSLTEIAAGRAEVWGLNGSQPYRFNPSTQKFVKISDKISGPLTQIAVGGGSLLQPDEVWGINASGLVYQYNFSTKAFVYVSGGIECKLCAYLSYSQVVVGPGYEDNCHPYEVWGITNFGTGRYNYCSSQFESIPNPSGVSFSQIATGGGDVWGNQSSRFGYAWEYLGAAGWRLGADNAQGFQQITVGVNDVWVVVGDGLIWNWAPDADGQDLVVFSPTWLPTQIATGGDGVWAIYNTSAANGLITRYDFQEQGFSAEFLLTSPAVQIAVGSGAGVWAIDSSNRVYALVRP
jgi:hypothetical protein